MVHAPTLAYSVAGSEFSFCLSMFKIFLREYGNVLGWYRTGLLRLSGLSTRFTLGVIWKRMLKKLPFLVA
jgi:hypothetical protein